MNPTPEEPPHPLLRLSAAAVAIGFAGLATLTLCAPLTRVTINATGTPPSFASAVMTATIPAALSGFLLWFAALADSTWHRRQMRSAVKWGMGMGAIGFLIGFAAPLFTSSKKMLGPLLAFYITGPLGIPVGLALRSLLPFALHRTLPKTAPATFLDALPWGPRSQRALGVAAGVYLTSIILECITLRQSPETATPLELTLVPFVTIPNAFLTFVAAWGVDASRDLRMPAPRCGPFHNRLAVLIGLLAITRLATIAIGELALLRDARHLPKMSTNNLQQYLKNHPHPDHFRLALAADNPNASPESLDTLANAPRKKLLASRNHLLPVLGNSQEARKGCPAINLLLRHPNLSESSRMSLLRLKATSAP